MAKQKSSKTAVKATSSERQIDRLFVEYAANNNTGLALVLQFIFVPLFCFGFFALVWSLPFPYIKFLGQFNGFINWASFLLAIGIYLYYKLSPVLSYFILFTLFGFSYLIVQLEYWEKAGGPALWQASLAILVMGLVGYLVSAATTNSTFNLAKSLKHLFIAPVYLWHLILKKVSIKY